MMSITEFDAGFDAGFDVGFDAGFEAAINKIVETLREQRMDPQIHFWMLDPDGNDLDKIERYVASFSRMGRESAA